MEAFGLVGAIAVKLGHAMRIVTDRAGYPEYFANGRWRNGGKSTKIRVFQIPQGTNRRDRLLPHFGAISIRKTLLGQRIYALAVGHEDRNDYGELRHDLALSNTALATASPNRIRLTLLRIGAVVVRNTRRIRLMLSSACPHQDLFRIVAARLDTS